MPDLAQSNLLLDFDLDHALQQAKELDDYQAKYGKLKGPLHGLPVSMKDQLHAKGLETTMGYVGWVGTFEGRRGTGKEGHCDSGLVRHLRSLGAIPFAKVSMLQQPSPLETILDLTCHRQRWCKVFG